MTIPSGQMPPKTPHKWLGLYIAGGVTALILFAALVVPHGDGGSTPSASSAVPPEAEPAAVAVPDSLGQFEAAVNQAQHDYQDADNELKKSVVRRRRDEQIKSALPDGTFENWPGVLKRLATNGDGNAYIEVKPDGCECVIQTWNNDFSDMDDHTLIPMKSNTYGVLLNMHEGDRILVSGRVLRESSLTEEGSVDEPGFITRFSGASPSPN